MALPTKPTFIIIGAHRCATRWLRVNLGHHPDVYVPAHELGYFSDPEMMERIGPTGYRRLYAGWEGQSVVGECSPSYSMPKNSPVDVVARITWSFPNVRLLMLVRNPYDRAYSATLEAIRTGELSDDVRFDQLDPEVLSRLQILENSVYAWAVGAYQNVVGDALKVVVVDDLADDPGAVYDSVLGHIGLEPGFRPPDLETPLFTSRRMMASMPPLDPEHRRQVLSFLEGSVERLEELIGRELPDWHPG